MKRLVGLYAIALLFTSEAFSQFHTLNIPQASPLVQETQRLGVTDISINYSSPALRGRDVWSDLGIIPYQADPLPWRAGANMATTISFSTDVMVEGEPLKAGTYAFYVIPEGESFELLFAHNHQQWGSYYLDLDKDISLRVRVKSETCAKTEQLDYEFLNREEDELTIGLEWDTVRIPFRVAVDLNQTVVQSFRDELRGINTYHWQAWNDAAMWCLNHNTNLEEALEWATRSIEGGYGGFAANKNPTNVVTKLRLLKRLGDQMDFDKTFKDAETMMVDADQANELNVAMLRFGKYEQALDYAEKQYKLHPEQWSLLLNRAIAGYHLDMKKQAVKDVRKVIGMAPDQFGNRLNEIIAEFEAGTYQLTQYN